MRGQLSDHSEDNTSHYQGEVCQSESNSKPPFSYSKGHVFPLVTSVP